MLVLHRLHSDVRKISRLGGRKYVSATESGGHLTQFITRPNEDFTCEADEKRDESTEKGHCEAAAARPHSHHVLARGSLEWRNQLSYINMSFRERRQSLGQQERDSGV